MKLRTFSVVGGALNFGLRRMETIMRVAWLPVVLLLVFNMASVFAVLSVANDRIITFADLARGISYEKAVEVSQKALWSGLLNGSVPMWTISMLTVALDTILIASFMAPLIRFAGLGEPPSPGALKLAFGPDQIRYILATILGIFVTLVFVLAPVGAAAYWVLNYILEALTQTYVSFPNPDSLHTIELVAARDVYAERGELWANLYGAPLIVAGGFALVFWLTLTMHFHPGNRGAGAGAPNLPIRALFTLAPMAGLAGLIWLGIRDPKDPDSASLSALYAIGILMIEYFSLRIFPYAGIAVCRRSLAPAGLLKVTRGWNIFRLLAVILLVGVFVIAVQYVVNALVFGGISIASVVEVLYAATASATKLVNSGETAPWVLPLFIWIWNGVKILVNIFLLFFLYGVIAGLQGRLHRESELVEA